MALRLFRKLSRACQPVLIGLLCFAVTGCTRQYWREQADCRTYEAIGERYNNPQWTNPRTDITPDPLSRFYDPYDPDCAPLPPDDPAAHEYMHCVYGMQGYKHWHKFGDTPTVENPDWLQPYGGTPEVVSANYSHPGVLPDVKNLTLEEALGLSYRHGREFQSELENVYLNALALTFQRFRFDTQFLGTSGRRPGADLFYNVSDSRSDLNLDSRVGVSRFFPTGAQFAAELANNTVWLFSGPNTSNTQSAISFSLVQPLLRDGGRRFALETLTQAERDVLYSVRDFARYRQGHFTNIVAGQRSSGSVSGVGNSFGNVGNGGYLGLLQQYQQILNTQFNIRLQEQQVAQLRAQAERPLELRERLEALPANVTIPPPLQTKLSYDPDRKVLILRGQLTLQELDAARVLSDDIDYLTALDELYERSSADVVTLEVAQIESQLAGSRISLATAYRQYQDTLDNFKIGIGLPPDLSLSIDKSMLAPFELIDPDLVNIQDSFRFFIRDISAIDEMDPDQQQLARVADALKILDDTLRAKTIDVIKADLERVVEIVNARGEIPLEEQVEGVPPYDPARDLQIFASIDQQLLELEADLADVRGQLSQPGLSQDERKKLLRALTVLQNAFFSLSQGLALVQVDVRLELIPLNPFRMPQDQAVAIALENRLDLMNFRADVMDARRAVEVAANQLQSVLDVVAEGDVRTPSIGAGNDNPLDFREDDSDYRVGLSFTTPIQLVSERNTYRAALINYQRARRRYMQEEDNVKADIRFAWRQLDTLKRNFTTAKFATRIAALQYDQTAEQTQNPTRRSTTGGGGGNQGLNLLRGFDDILRAQNQLISIWVQFESNRLNIHRDMGTMVIDDRGFWIDSYYQDRLAKAGYCTLPEQRSVDPPTLAIAPTDPAGQMPGTPEPTPPAGVQSPATSPAGNPAPSEASPQELPNGSARLQPPATVPPNGVQPASAHVPFDRRRSADPPSPRVSKRRQPSAAR